MNPLNFGVRTSGPAKKCAWHALKGKEDGAGYCYVDNEYMAAVSAQPTTYIAKVNAVTDRLPRQSKLAHRLIRAQPT